MLKGQREFQCKCNHSFSCFCIKYLSKKVKHSIGFVAVAVMFFLIIMVFPGGALSVYGKPFSLRTEVSEFYSDTINKPELVKAIYMLTAENGKAIGPNIKYMPEWSAFGWFTAADRVEWEVDVARTSEYEVRIEWSVSDEDAGKQFLLQAGNKRLTGTVAPSGSWTTFKTQSAGRIYLRAGRQKLIFKSNKSFREGALLDLRSITLIPLNK